MAAYVKRFASKDGSDIYYPQTKSEAVIRTDNSTSVETSLQTIEDELDNIPDIEAMLGRDNAVTVANNNLSTAMARGIIISDREPTASDGEVGQIWIVYQE